MPAITALAAIETAFGILNVTMPGESVDANSATFALGVLNRMIGGWSQRALLSPVILRARFDLVANQGGPTTPYTIGVGGDFDTPKPANQNSLVGAVLIATTTTPEGRTPLGMATDQAYASNTIPALTGAEPTGLYYDPTYEDDFGSIYLWPVPDNATYDIELFIQQTIPRFATLGTELWVPEGVDDALVYNLAVRLAGPYGRQMTPEDKQLAVTTLGVVKRSNTKLSDQLSDAYFATAGRRTIYDIQSGG